MEPLGRADAMVAVCAACDARVIADDGPDRGYEPTGGTLSPREAHEGMLRVTGTRRMHPADLSKPLTPGWILVRRPATTRAGRKIDRGLARSRMPAALRFVLGFAFGTFASRLVTDVRAGVWDRSPAIALPAATSRSIKRQRLAARADLCRVLPGNRITSWWSP